MSLLALFCDVDSFCQKVEWQQQRALPAHFGQKVRQPGLWPSDIMTILIHFHPSGYRCFKAYYQPVVVVQLRSEFPQAVSDPRFVRLIPRAVVLVWAYAQYRCGRCTGISFVDSTALKVGHNRRIGRNRVFAGVATRGQSSTGWFYGFKWHLVVNDQGDLLAFHLTPANVDDRKPVPRLAVRLFGKLFGDKGYLWLPLFKQLFERGVHLMTKLRANMKNKLVPLVDKLLLRKRWIIETLNDHLKNISQIEHSRHRRPLNFVANVLAGWIAYIWQPKKPHLRFTRQEANALSLC